MKRSTAMLAVALVAGTAAAQEPSMTWQDAVAELAGERARAETCVSLLKRHAAEEPSVLSRGELAYAEAKADVDGAISGLVITLARDEELGSVDAIVRRLQRGVEAREAFCIEAVALVPDTSGTKSLITDVLGKVLSSLINAAKEIYLHHQDENVLMRKTIQTQLEATRWRAFADIQP